MAIIAILHVDILKGENFSSIEVADKAFIYWTVHSSSRMAGGGERDGGGILILASFEDHFEDSLTLGTFIEFPLVCQFS